MYNVKLFDMGIYVKFQINYLAKDWNPLPVDEFYPLCFCSQLKWFRSVDKDSLIQRLNALMEHEVQTVPGQLLFLDRKTEEICCVNLCLYTKDAVNKRKQFLEIVPKT